VWRFAHDGAELPDEMRKLGVDWVDAATPTPAATTDATVKQVQAGIIPATSDVTLAKLNYSAAQRARLEQDRKLDQAAQLESELTASLAARQARSGNAIANDLEAAAAPPAPPRP
jgi:isochorismate hydrolase